MRRTIMAGVSLVVVAGAALTAWTTLRPGWQTSALADELRDIPGVVLVEEPSEKYAAYGDVFEVELADDASAKRLSQAFSEVTKAVADREIGGDEQKVHVHTSGFVLSGGLRTEIADGDAQAIVALRDIDGLAGSSANETTIEMRVARRNEALPRVLEAVTRLRDAKLLGVDAHLIVRSLDGDSTISVGIDSVEKELPVLARVARLADDHDAWPARDNGIKLYVGIKDKVNCSANMIVDRADQVREVRRAFAALGTSCHRTVNAAAVQGES